MLAHAFLAVAARAMRPDEQTSQVGAVFSWSSWALAPAPARAFRLLGLHPGQNISTAAAAALLDAPVPETRQLLKILTGGHLLKETGRDRYQFDNLVRVYAAECARTSEREAQQATAIRRLLTCNLHTADAFLRTSTPTTGSAKSEHHPRNAKDSLRRAREVNVYRQTSRAPSTGRSHPAAHHGCPRELTVTYVDDADECVLNRLEHVVHVQGGALSW